jgi:hypothetical protein
MDPMITVSIPSDQFTEVNELVDGSIEGITSDEFSADGAGQLALEEMKQEKLDAQWIFLGYLFSFFAIVGIFIGLTLINSSRRLRNGERIRMYDPSTIRHGRIMILIGILTTFWFAWKKFIAVFVLGAS